MRLRSGAVDADVTGAGCSLMQLVAEVDLVPRRENARCARLAVHEALAGMGPGLRQDAELVVSELVTNAVVHAGSGTIRLRVWLQPGCCRFEVSDCSSALPVPYDLDVDSRGGRGLRLIEAVGIAWGAVRDPLEGKTVWCELSLTDPDSTTRP